MEDTTDLILERRLNASVDLVWEALTNRDFMKHWYFVLPEFKAEVGFEFSFYGGPPEKSYLHLCRVTCADKHRKMAYTWKYDGYAGESEVSFELFPEGNMTRLVLTHKGLHTFPAEMGDFARHNFQMGWTGFLDTRLKEFVEQFDQTIITRRHFNAKQEQVWAAWTNPEHLKNWWGPQGFTNTFHTYDFQPGGSWKFTMHAPDGQEFPNECVFVEMTEPQKLVFDHLEPVHKFRVVATFDPDGNQTDVTFKMIFDDVEECKRMRSFIAEKNEENFDKLAAELEKMNA